MSVAKATGVAAAVDTAVSVRLSGLTKTFGSFTAVDGLSLSVNSGEVLGFLGPNGAGKTTTMRMLVGLLSPTRGSANILGHDVRRREPAMLAEIGYLPGSLRLYENLSAREFLRFVATMRRRNCDQQISGLADRLQLDVRKHLHDLSKGNRQKVGVIAAFMHEPRVLILDEPTSGLDPLMQREFEGMLAEAAARGAAVILSSHVMSEVENLSHRVAIINAGKLLILEDTAQLKLTALQRLEFTFDRAVDGGEFLALPGVRSAHAIGNRIVCEVTGPESEVVHTAAMLGVLSVRSHEPTLDEIFLDLITTGGHR
jgi:ABC-2 type transport system ATP-binding protein